MDKTESALEFTRRMAEDGLQGNLYGLKVSIESRDTAFRADERQKAAERLCQAKCPSIAESTDPVYRCGGCELRVAIMAEPEEGE